MSKMFKTVTKTWNPFTGCGFDCSYCWAKALSKGKLANNYPNGFVPTFHPERVNRKFKAGEFVFVSSMGDISFCAWNPGLKQIREVIANNPDTSFLLQTKNPSMFLDGTTWEANIYQGCTIETNRPILVSKAPVPTKRYHSAAMNNHPHKFLSIEPVMDFDLEIFASWAMDINPEIVEIGADNYHNGLPEPSWDKVYKLIDILTLHGVQVKQKDGLDRLQKPERIKE